MRQIAAFAQAVAVMLDDGWVVTKNNPQVAGESWGCPAAFFKGAANQLIKLQKVHDYNTGGASNGSVAAVLVERALLHRSG